MRHKAARAPALLSVALGVVVLAVAQPFGVAPLGVFAQGVGTASDSAIPPLGRCGALVLGRGAAAVGHCGWRLANVGEFRAGNSRSEARDGSRVLARRRWGTRRGRRVCRSLSRGARRGGVRGSSLRCARSSAGVVEVGIESPGGHLRAVEVRAGGSRCRRSGRGAGIGECLGWGCPPHNLRPAVAAAECRGLSPPFLASQGSVLPARGALAGSRAAPPASSDRSSALRLLPRGFLGGRWLPGRCPAGGRSLGAHKRQRRIGEGELAPQLRDSRFC